MPLTAIALSIALAQSESAVGRYLPYAPAENYSGVGTPFLEKPLRLWSNGKADLYPLLGGTWQQTGQVIIITVTRFAGWPLEASPKEEDNMLLKFRKVGSKLIASEGSFTRALDDLVYQQTPPLTMDEILTAWAEFDDQETEAAGAEAFDFMRYHGGDPEVQKQIVAAMKDDERESIQRSAIYLSYLAASPEIVDTLKAIALSDESTVERRISHTALANLATDEAIAVLSEAYATGKASFTWFCHGLKRNPNPKYADQVIRAIETKEASGARLAFEVLWRMDSKSAIPVALKFVQSEDPGVSIAARICVLGLDPQAGKELEFDAYLANLFRSASSLEELVSEAQQKGLATFFSFPDDHVAEVLATSRSEAGKDIVLDVLRNQTTNNWLTVVACAEAAADWGERSVLPALKNYLKPMDDEALRSRLQSAIRRLESE